MMKKKRFFCWLLTIVMLVSGCSAFTHVVSQYTLSENNINNYLKKQLGTVQKINKTALVNISLAFNELNAQIGRNDSNKITLSGSATIRINSIISDQQANLKLNISALPYFDDKQGAIFLKNIELNDYLVDSSLGTITNKTLLPFLNTLLQTYFNNQAVYKLDTKHNSIEAIVLKTTKYIKVEYGKIIFENNNNE